MSARELLQTTLVTALPWDPRAPAPAATMGANSRCMSSAIATALPVGSGIGTGSLKKTIMPSPAKCSSVPP